VQWHNPNAMARHKIIRQGCRGVGDDRNAHPGRLSLQTQ
jgi:hypothetical protein